MAPVAHMATMAEGYHGPALILEPSPSGINALPAVEQQAWFFASMFLVLGGTWLVKTKLFPLIDTLLPAGWYPKWRNSFPIIGAVFALAGASHFALLAEYSNIYPPPGAWGGLWQLPGSAAFHVTWTGVAEFTGGVGLLVCGTFKKSPELAKVFAAALFALVVAVTPANIYMFTHGAQLPPGVETPIEGHVIRCVLQWALLGVLWEVAAPIDTKKTPEEEDLVV